MDGNRQRLGTVLRDLFNERFDPDRALHADVYLVVTVGVSATILKDDGHLHCLSNLGDVLRAGLQAIGL